ncbi:MAG TPA: bifunctional phosphoribosylaminoimidazolecarboxamide formyltransferase/IMP cyclohydrolase [Anaerolineales bacterium]|nr:bifunctional phosphoribosylaminoimidazolecarboxamide formyltransferase/IMP cyclohydrolase [Anaerolineales bacterium]
MPIALLSLSDKTGLVALAHELHQLGWQLLASGGTAKAISQVGLPVTEVADYTASPEVLGGRVKTLHPAIHAGLLARTIPSDQVDLARQGWHMIDLVAVNLYPFQKVTADPAVAEADAIENIDIGGVTLIRAAAKNHERVTLLTDPNDYAPVLAELQANGQTSPATRKLLAVKGFAHTAQYDSAIASYFGASNGALQLTAYPIQNLRYGENPHQSATLYGWQAGQGPLGGHLLQGKALSYNNILDLDAAWRGVLSFSAPSIVIVKHLSPCGIASAHNLVTAYQHALACDPVSAFGGVIAVNRPFDAETATALGKLFVECIAAPSFTPQAREILAKKENLRLLEIPYPSNGQPLEMRSVQSGLLVQSLDVGDPLDANWQVVTERQPTPAEWDALRFAWLACQHVKSNAIVFARPIDGGATTVGIGGGQPNRVDCVHIAGKRAQEQAHGAVMASDAFFPFPDSVEAAGEYGITAIVQPGGSMRDEQSIATANRLGMAMVTTGVRHFRH